MRNEFVHSHRPSLLRILSGLFKPNHLRQFASFVVAFCIVLWIVRAISIATLLLIIAVCGALMALLACAERVLCRAAPASESDDAPLIDSAHDRAHQLRYDLRALDSDGRCGVCLAPMRAGAEAATLDCEHSFHPECIERWATVQDACPLCHAPFA